VKLLVERGERVRVLVRPSSSLAHLPIDRIELAYGDVTVQHGVFAALAGVRRLYHVASVFKMWDRRPERILGPAIVGTRETLEAARRRGVEKVVVTSSCATLGASREPVPMDESMTFALEDPETYILAKVRAEEIALPVVVVMPSGVFGPGDWKPTPSGDLVLRYLEWPSFPRFPLTSGGISVADVDDVVRGHVLAMERGKAGERYIVGGDNLSFPEILDLLHRITGLPGPGPLVPPSITVASATLIEIAARLFGFEPPVTRRMARDHADTFLWADSTKAETELGYEHRPARQSLARSVAWFLEKGYVSQAAARRIDLDPTRAE
jgi:dihydroflavonol-4-reductase